MHIPRGKSVIYVAMHVCYVMESAHGKWVDQS